MDIVIYSDPHIHEYKTFNRVERSRLDVCIDIVKEPYKYAASIGAPLTLMVGDWYDTGRLIPPAVVNRSTELLLELKNNYPDVITLAISGNHDHGSKNLLHKPAVTALTHLQDIAPDNFKVIDDKTIPFTLANVSVSGIPYYENSDDFNIKLKEQADKVNSYKASGKIGFNTCKILMIHQTPKGLGNPNIPVDTDPNDSIYDAWDIIVCGHIHTKMQLTDKFFIIGNTHHRDLGDCGEEKGFWVLNTEAKKMDFVSLKGKYPEYRKEKVRSGETVTDDGLNYYVPQYVEEVSGVTAEGVVVEDFAIDLSAAQLIENYCNQVAPDREELLKVGLSCLKIKAEA